MDLFPVPRPSEAEFFIVETSGSGVIAGGFIYADHVFIEKDVVLMNKVKSKFIYKTPRTRPLLGVGYGGYCCHGSQIEIEYAETYTSLIVPRASIINIFSLSDWKGWGITRAWALRNLADAEAEGIKRLAEENAKIAVENKKLLPMVEADYVVAEGRRAVETAWHGMGFFERLWWASWGGAKDKFEKHFMISHVVDISYLHRRLDEKGVDYK